MRKSKSIGSLMAQERWKKASAEDRKAVGRKLADARLAKREALPLEQSPDIPVDKPPAEG